jgi:hypothetical protein
LTWLKAFVRGIAIVAYFIVATVWLPNTILETSLVAEASWFVRDTVVMTIWGIALFGGMYGLRQAQTRGII